MRTLKNFSMVGLSKKNSKFLFNWTATTRQKIFNPAKNSGNNSEIIRDG